VALVEKGEALPFDVLLGTPSTAAWFRPFGRVLGPKGLVPSERRGTVIEDFSSYSSQEVKGTEINLDAEGKGKAGAMARIPIGKVPSSLPSNSISYELN
jgi:large subunit ribosomal protein L1